MGKGEGRKKQGALDIGPSRTLREEGKATANPSGLANVCTVKKMQHLQRVAFWAAGEGSILPLGALLGTRLAATGEASGIPPPDSPFFTCERCETILQPGLNCHVRVLKHPCKARHKPRSLSKSVNVVVYTCNFCLHKNMKPGTPRDYLTKLKSQTTPIAKLKLKSDDKINVKQAKERNTRSRILASIPPSGSTLTTPTLGNISSTKKRRQKSWSTLKELASANQKPPSFSNLSALKIPPFSL